MFMLPCFTRLSLFLRGQVDYAYNLGLVDQATYKQTLDICEVSRLKVF